MKIYIYLIIIFFLFSKCNDKEKSTIYELSYSKKDSLSEEFFPVAPKTIILKNDSITIVDYEPYIPLKKGIITKNKIIIQQTDTIVYKLHKEFLITYDDSLIYYWQRK